LRNKSGAYYSQSFSELSSFNHLFN